MKIAGVPGLLLCLCVAGFAQTNSYTVTPIVNNTQDSYLVNPWGISRPVSSSVGENEWWVSDEMTGFTTLYYANQSGKNSLAPLVISIPPASGTGVGSPTGTAFNPGVGPGPSAENFTFATLDGLIANWNSGSSGNGGGGCYRCHANTTTTFVNHNSMGASYTGGVEVYDAATFHQVTLPGTFTDPKIPAGYRPFGIQAVSTFIVVTFYNDISGGYVDAFDTNENLKGRLAHGVWFSQPWGITLAPAKFGVFSNTLLVGNTTTGTIAAFSTTNGAFKGVLDDSTGHALSLPGLWGIEFGNGNVESGPTTTLYSTAGGNYLTGVFGAITAN